MYILQNLHVAFYLVDSTLIKLFQFVINILQIKKVHVNLCPLILIIVAITKGNKQHKV